MSSLTMLSKKGCKKVQTQVEKYFTSACNEYNEIWLPIDKAKYGEKFEEETAIELYAKALAKTDANKRLIKEIDKGIERLTEYKRNYDEMFTEKGESPDLLTQHTYRINVELLNFMLLAKDELLNMNDDYEILKEHCYEQFDDFTKRTVEMCVKAIQDGVL